MSSIQMRQSDGKRETLTAGPARAAVKKPIRNLVRRAEGHDSSGLPHREPPNYYAAT